MVQSSKWSVALACGALVLGAALAVLNALTAGAGLAMARSVPSVRAGEEPGPPAIITLTVPLTLEVGAVQGAVVAEVVDATGEFVADGTAVLLDTTLGRLGTSSLTTCDGAVTTTLETGRLAGSAKVSAKAGEIITHRLVSFLAGPPAAITVTPASSSVRVDESVPLRLAVRDEYDNPARDGISVTLTPARGVISPTTAALSGGLATVHWQNGVAGKAVVTATVGAVTGTALVEFRPGPPEGLWLLVDQPILPVDDGVTDVRARLTDRFGNLSNEVRTVLFWCDGGVLTPSSVATIGGVASTKYRAGAASGEHSLTASAGGLRAQYPISLRPADLGIALAEVAGPRGRARQTQTYPGEHLTFTLAARNRGLATARDVVLASELPDPLTAEVVAASREITDADGVPPGLLKPPGDGYHQRAWRLGDLSAGDAVTIALTGALDRGHSWSGFDALFFRSAVTTTTAEGSSEDLERTETAHVYAADLFATISLDAEASSLRPGGQLAYDIAFGNLQLLTEVGPVRITDTLPALTRYDHWQPNLGTVLQPVGKFDRESRQVVWTFDGPFGLNQGLRLWLAIEPEALPESVIENEVAIGSRIHDIEPANNERSDGGVRLHGVNLTVEVAGPETVAPGEELTYEITIRNASRQDTAHGVELVSYPPEGVQVVRTDPVGLVLLDGRVRWKLDALAAGGVRRYELVARVLDGVALGTYFRHRVEVSSRDPESHTPDNSDESWTRVVPGVPAQITVRADSATLSACTEDFTMLAAEVTDRVGHAVADGTEVRWSTTLGTLSAPESATVDGLASVALHAGRLAGRASIGAGSGGLLGQTIVVIVPGPPASLAVSTDPMKVRRSGSTTVAVNVLDGCANPVADGWPIELAVERGRFLEGSRTIVLPTVNGRVRATLVADQEPGPLRIVARYGSTRGETVLSVEDRWLVELFVPFASNW